MNKHERKARNEQICELFKSGLSCREIAVQFGVSRALVAWVVSQHGLKRADYPHPLNHNRKEAAWKRQREMAALYRQGLTLAQIGDRYGVSRERVRQLIAELGMSYADGGIHKRVEERNKRRAARIEARYQRIWGCSKEQYDEIAAEHGRHTDAGSPFGMYVQQRNNANRRGIEWGFTFWSWWQMWLESGQWGNRGREKGQYVMARFGDTGPYSPDNVAIVTTTENIIEYYERAYGGDYAETLAAARCVA